jgi:hypothetical protein
MSRTPNPTGSRKISFNVSEQYDIQDVVGEGAYGVVWLVHPSHEAWLLTLVRPGRLFMLTVLSVQLCASQTQRAEGCDKEDHAFRSLHVLSADST